jgi:two-component system nitrate/nitrite response regulator NarL
MLSGPDTDDPLAALSQRERAVAALVVRGLRNREIASELDITEGTVKIHLHKVYEKLGVSSRTELVIYAKDML